MPTPTLSDEVSFISRFVQTTDASKAQITFTLTGADGSGGTLGDPFLVVYEAHGID